MFEVIELFNTMLEAPVNMSHGHIQHQQDKSSNEATFMNVYGFSTKDTTLHKTEYVLIVYHSMILMWPDQSKKSFGIRSITSQSTFGISLELGWTGIHRGPSCNISKVCVH